jgi:hypothetical protein
MLIYNKEIKDKEYVHAFLELNARTIKYFKLTSPNLLQKSTDQSGLFMLYEWKITDCQEQLHVLEKQDGPLGEQKQDGVPRKMWEDRKECKWPCKLETSMDDLQIVVLWVVPHILVGVHQCFGGTCLLHFQG